MRILIVGATGKLGSALVERLKLDNHHLHTTEGRSELDITDLSRLTTWVGSIRPAIIINASAMNGMEACEKDSVSAFIINGVVPGVLAELAGKQNALYFHFSTDYVLKSNDPNLINEDWWQGMTEYNEPHPWGIYGHSKRAGEMMIEAIGGQSIVMRLSSIYGDYPAGSTEVLAQLKRGRGTAENPIQVLRQFTAPTSVKLIADAVAHVIATVPHGRWNDVSGLYHFAARKGMWKRHFAGSIIENKDIIIEEGKLIHERPEISLLNSEKFSQTFDYDIPTVMDDWKRNNNT